MESSEIRDSLSGLSTRADIPQDVRDELNKMLGKLTTPLQTDVWIYRLVVSVLGIVIIATVLGGIYIAVIAHGDATISLPDGIIAIGSAAVGALAGLLAPTPQS